MEYLGPIEQALAALDRCRAAADRARRAALRASEALELAKQTAATRSAETRDRLDRAELHAGSIVKSNRRVACDTAEPISRAAYRA